MTAHEWITWIDVAVLATVGALAIAWYGWMHCGDAHENQRRNVAGICLLLGSLSAIAGCLVGRM